MADGSREEVARIGETGEHGRWKQRGGSTDRRNRGASQMEAKRSSTDRRNRGVAQMETAEGVVQI
jgi:hypothetical protein